jgi:hypothetical protein
VVVVAAILFSQRFLCFAIVHVVVVAATFILQLSSQYFGFGFFIIIQPHLAQFVSLKI